MNMKEEAVPANTIYLKDYQPPAYSISNTVLDVEIFEEETFVTSTLSLLANQPGAELVLNGEELTLVAIEINGTPLEESAYSVNDTHLTLHNPPEEFTLTTKVKIYPKQNTSLEGLYKSRTIYCTQCEAEGFRKITYYLDRPDVMSDFVTRISADKASCPLLLSNGNMIEKGDLDNGRHYVAWHDPHKKPAYLFALVAGDLSVVEDTFTTMSGRNVELKIFVESKDLDKCQHAMDSLKRSMAWDEEVYGREYDLDIFMIVAVDDFNMGAMENKGLNIFNTSCVLASPTTTTDAGFQRVEGVVAHEYFHNWSGNRVTCRDWFQLSLKEGFTVYRDSEFSADMGSRTVKRLEDVAFLRNHQFPEDAGPMAHPIRPESYMEISNFYTLTVYEKGAEVVRMLANLLGPQKFRQATDLYFERHDGQAVTTEDFVQAMEDVSGRDLTQFKRWYSQAGTPTLKISDGYDEANREYCLTVTQQTPATPECDSKQPFHIPLRIGLLGDAGALPLRLKGDECEGDGLDMPEDNTDRVLEVCEGTQTFVFTDIPERPVPSLLRGFSAPVKVEYNYSRDDLCRLALNDSDGFNRYEATQNLALACIQDALTQSSFTLDERLVSVYTELLGANNVDLAMIANMLILPAESYIAGQQTKIDPLAIHKAREAVRLCVAEALRDQLHQVYQRHADSGPYSTDAEAIARRSLRNTVLGYLLVSPKPEDIALCEAQLASATNMTDEFAALSSLVLSPNYLGAPADKALQTFYEKWSHEPLVVNQWLSVQARVAGVRGLQNALSLLDHPAYDAGNPNKIRSVIGSLCNTNASAFHRLERVDHQGQTLNGYEFLAAQIASLDGKNPQIAARLLAPLTPWRRYEKQYAEGMRGQLEKLKALPELSPDSYEVISKSLK